ncbi:cell wall metabolism sensor histidine kinase WalK [Cellulomonas sp. P24]|uniref:sensor histidine kinase n=1 Tax=Cellulomonas sp. P24 TaxID=2885206 RepID=UPI00216B58F3|nr:ATP-binding protein [Cellulomonas sp. P24]MCR6494343.1 HAMP domain-containing protein [Cellulomonas sp. P24]
MRRRRGSTAAPLGFAWRLGASLGLVVLAGGVTLLGVALAIAPQLFQLHLRMAEGPRIEPTVQNHVDEAFASAILTALGIAVPVALLTSWFVTWIVARRLGRSVATVANAADRIARGQLDARITTPAIGPEFTQLTESFNAMAARLAETESMRRQLIGDLAHELRTPLAALDATVTAVADGVLPVDGTTLETLTGQTRRLQHLVADMSAVSRAEERQLDLHPRAVELVAVADEAVASNAARFVAAGIQLDLEVDGTSPVVEVDTQRLGEAVANLLDNALRHTAEGGRVTVVVRTEPDVGVLEVVDSGEGFDPGDSGRIFERFYRGDLSRTRSSAGTGVGLTIARAIVQAHGGTLTAVSEGLGTGATFRLVLPTRAARSSDGV